MKKLRYYIKSEPNNILVEDEDKLRKKMKLPGFRGLIRLVGEEEPAKPEPQKNKPVVPEPKEAAELDNKPNKPA